MQLLQFYKETLLSDTAYGCAMHRLYSILDNAFGFGCWDDMFR